MCALEIGIVGLPNAGKTTLLNALARINAQVASFPFTTVEPNVGVAPVPDPRLEKVAGLAGCDRLVPATVRFVDIAGLVEGASRGEGLGNRFLAKIREVHAIVHVVRAFDAQDVSHVVGDVDPLRDVELIDTEIRLADLEHLSRMIEKARRDLKKGGREYADRLAALLELEKLIEKGGFDPRDPHVLALGERASAPGLLSLKPTILALNVGEEGESGGADLEGLREWARSRGIPILRVCAKLEAELAELDEEEAEDFIKELGIEEESISKLARAGYELLGLMTFFSIDSGECRAWPVRRGTNAQQAAGRIHTDFEKGFIKAEVVHYDDFVRCGGFHAAREAGCLLVEGKEYVVRDGDVIHFKFSA